MTNTKKVQKVISKKNPYNQISLVKELGCSQYNIHTIIHSDLQFKTRKKLMLIYLKINTNRTEREIQEYCVNWA